MAEREKREKYMAEESRYFPAGAEVEVSSEEEGFRGSWYAATVITPPPTSSTTRTTRNATAGGGGGGRGKKVTIEFKDLMEDDEGKRRLRETLKLVQIRPVPPREAKVEFKLSDSVDAYYNDGWWEGVITKILDDGRFGVYFRSSKELLEFGEEDLRIHREWVYGEWIPPLITNQEDESLAMHDNDRPSRLVRSKPSKASPTLEKPSNATVSNEKPSEASSVLGSQYEAALLHEKASKGSISIEKHSKANLACGKPSKVVLANEKRALKDIFIKGAAVEVTSDEDGFQGAWFSATILEVLSNEKFLIEYKYLRTDDDKEFCKEEVDILHIRPPPPDIVKINSYAKYEEVDALHNDGWWTGVISKVYSGSRYLVFFRGTNEEMKFNHSDLRVHQEWIDCKWIVTFQGLEL